MRIVDRLRELEAKATPGPWRTEALSIGTRVRFSDSERRWSDDSVCAIESDMQYADAALIAATRNALGKLLAVAEAAMALRDANEDGSDLRPDVAWRDMLVALRGLDGDP